MALELDECGVDIRVLRDMEGEVPTVLYGMLHGKLVSTPSLQSWFDFQAGIRGSSKGRTTEAPA